MANLFQRCVEPLYNGFMQDVYLGLGSNLGDRAAMLRDAVAAIGRLPACDVIRVATPLETPPMGPQDQGAYLNTAAHLRTNLDARGLMRALQQIETQLGRADARARRRWGPREIDIDILLYGSDVISVEGLTVPHAGMHERRFVLEPLAQIAPKLRHPVLGQTIEALLLQIDAVHTDPSEAVL